MSPPGSLRFGALASRWLSPRAVGQHPGCCGDSQGTQPSQYFLLALFLFHSLTQHLRAPTVSPALRMEDAQQHALLPCGAAIYRGKGGDKQSASNHVLYDKCTEGGKCGAGEVATSSLG